MLEFRKISLYTEEELEEMDSWQKSDYHVLRMDGAAFFLNPKTMVTDLMDSLELPGSYDTAVPENWARSNNYPKGMDFAFWYYPRDTHAEGHLFGKPFTVREMIVALRKEVQLHPELLVKCPVIWTVVKTEGYDYMVEAVSPQEACNLVAKGKGERTAKADPVTSYKARLGL